MLSILKKFTNKGNYRNLQEGDILLNELNDKIKQSAILLDVRSPQEYAEGHINGAILIPDYEINAKINELIKYRNNTVIVYCKSGARSRKVYNILKNIGFIDVYNLYGGIESI